MLGRHETVPSVNIREDRAPQHRLSRLILSNPNAEKTYRDFMWLYVGHQDPARRKAEGLPAVLRTFGDDFYNYSEQIVAGYTDQGDLVEIRSVEPVDPNHPKDYYMVMSHLETGRTQEPIVYQVRVESNGDKKKPVVYGTVFQLLSQSDLHHPPHAIPGMHALPRDQWRVVMRQGRPPEIVTPRRIVHEIRPIEELADVANAGLIERDGQLEVIQRPLGHLAVQATR